MKRADSVSELPSVPAVYAMYGGRGRSIYVAYVGIADSLRQRIIQHLVRRDSSIVTNVSAVGLNPDYVTEIRWWEHPNFENREVLEAAELVAFDVLDPALRSRGAITERAKNLYADSSWAEGIVPLFASEPTGVLYIPTLQDALEKISKLEERISILEAEFNKSKH
jgi:hypothetical protein